MDVNEIKEAIESFPSLLERGEQLSKRMIRFSGRDPEIAASNMQRFEAVNEKIAFVEYAIYESDILSDKESVILEHRSQGKNNQEIGDFFSLGRQRISQILNGIYQKLAS